MSLPFDLTEVTEGVFARKFLLAAGVCLGLTTMCDSFASTSTTSLYSNFGSEVDMDDPMDDNGDYPYGHKTPEMNGEVGERTPETVSTTDTGMGSP